MAGRALQSMIFDRNWLSLMPMGMETAATAPPATYFLPLAPSSTRNQLKMVLTMLTMIPATNAQPMLAKTIWFPVIHREFDAKHFCQEAYALLLWRMFWEKIDIPQQLFSRRQDTSGAPRYLPRCPSRAHPALQSRHSRRAAVGFWLFHGPMIFGQ